MKKLINLFGGTPTILCIWCGFEVPCIGNVPHKCPRCGHTI